MRCALVVAYVNASFFCFAALVRRLVFDVEASSASKSTSKSTVVVEGHTPTHPLVDEFVFVNRLPRRRPTTSRDTHAPTRRRVRSRRPPPKVVVVASLEATRSTVVDFYSSAADVAPRAHSFVDKSSSSLDVALANDFAGSTIDTRQMPQNEHMELHAKRYGARLDAETRARKKLARAPHERSRVAQKLIGLKAKLYAKKRHDEKVAMKKTLNAHGERTNKHKVEDDVGKGAIPGYLLDREQTTRAKVLSNTIKQKRKEKAGKWEVPLPKVRPIAEDEMFKVMRSGKRMKKSWKRVITKATFVGAGFTRKPPKYERFIRPSGLRFTKAHITHPELKATFQLEILGVKKNPNGAMYSSLGVLTKGTIVEVNVSELGLVTPGGKVVWGKYAQITNNPENDGCVNGVLLV